MSSLPPSLIVQTQIPKVLSTLIFVVVSLLAFKYEHEEMKRTLQEITQEQALRTHFAIVTEFKRNRQNWTTPSVMGSWLFKFDANVTAQNRTFLIYFKKYTLESMENCSVQNCIFTNDDKKLLTADAVLVPLQYGIIPKVKKRNLDQRWIFMNDESPYHVYSYDAKVKPTLKDLSDLFNWSMTYTIDADIPRVYGRTVPFDEPLIRSNDISALTEIIPNWKRKRRDILVTVLISDCGSLFRQIFIKKLQRYIPVDVYGKCSKNKTLQNICPGRPYIDCDLISEYIFYLALENSDCREYLTEKIWYNAYLKGAIPIILGPFLSDCKRLLPPNSFLHVPMKYHDDEIEELAKFIIELSEDEDSLLYLHQWRNHFEAVNEHGYFGRKSLLYCRLCEGLNYNDAGKKILSKKDISRFLDPGISCGKNVYKHKP